MTTVALPPPPEATVTRRFNGEKLGKLLKRLDQPPAWVALGARVSETSVRNWMSRKKKKRPDLDSYLDLVDFLRKQGIPEAEILDEIK